MDHLEATSLGATERYVLGTLGESEREAFEDHFFDCLECAEDVRAAAALLAGARSLPEVPGEGLSEIAREQAAAPAQRRKRPVLVRRSFTMVICAVGGAACFTAAFQRLVTIPRLEDELRRADSLQAVSSHFLTVSRSETPVIQVGPADRHVALTLSRSWDRAFSSYRCELQDTSGKVLVAETLPSPSSADELELLLPVRNRPAGSYVLAVEGVEPGGSLSHGPAPLGRYSFKLQRNGAAGSAAPLQ